MGAKSHFHRTRKSVFRPDMLIKRPHPFETICIVNRSAEKEKNGIEKCRRGQVASERVASVSGDGYGRWK